MKQIQNAKDDEHLPDMGPEDMIMAARCEGVSCLNELPELDPSPLLCTEVIDKYEGRQPDPAKLGASPPPSPKSPRKLRKLKPPPTPEPSPESPRRKLKKVPVPKPEKPKAKIKPVPVPDPPTPKSPKKKIKPVPVPKKEEPVPEPEAAAPAPAGREQAAL